MEHFLRKCFHLFVFVRGYVARACVYEKKAVPLHRVLWAEAKSSGKTVCKMPLIKDETYKKDETTETKYFNEVPPSHRRADGWSWEYVWTDFDLAWNR